jgi:transcriptional adapter 2-alpha
MAATSTKEEANAIREDWVKHKLNKYGGPTVLPPRPNDVCDMPGSDVAGFMPRREDFDIEWDNEAEKLLQDMEFLPNDSKEDIELKLKVCEVYNSRLDKRNNRKQFMIDRGMLDYRKKHIEENKLPADERDLVNRMRLFARFHSPEEHEKLIENLLKAKRLRKEIARLQMHRRMGFTSMADAERFELDRNRREIHRLACEQQEKKEKKALEGLSDGESGGFSALSATELNAAYMKQYKQNDRNKRKGLSTPESFNDVDVKMNELGDVAIGNDESQNAKPGQEPPVKSFDVRKCEGFELLTKRELDLCQKLELQPKLYNEAKTALINESLNHGILDDENATRRTIFKVDVEKKGDIYNFILQAGWVPPVPHSWHGK